MTLHFFTIKEIEMYYSNLIDIETGAIIDGFNELSVELALSKCFEKTGIEFVVADKATVPTHMLGGRNTVVDWVKFKVPIIEKRCN